MRKPKKPDVRLLTWLDLLQVLRTCAEEEAAELLASELTPAKDHTPRLSFARRIHSKVNSLRFEREVEEVEAAVKKAVRA